MTLLIEARQIESLATMLEDEGGHYLERACEIILDWNLYQGFWDEFNSGDVQHILSKHMLMVTEIAEASEGIRKNTMSDAIPEFTSEEEELADLVIRLLDYCGHQNIRLGRAIAAKLRYNLTRPRRHGKAC